MSWIQTHTGKKVEPLALTGDMVCIEDIAHALALKCRFTGHCRTFYSVAEHSVRVARLVKPELRLAALLHDAAEAYLPDFARPIKGRALFAMQHARTDALSVTSDFNGHGYELRFRLAQNDHRASTVLDSGLFRASDVEDTVLSVIYATFGVTGYSAAAIKNADLILLATEARDLMGPPPEPWSLDVPELPEVIQPWTWQQAETEFLAFFEIEMKKRQEVGRGE